MITTLFFMQLIGFQLWHITSKQVKHANKPRYLVYILNHTQRFRNIGVALFLLAMVLFVMKWGFMTGICTGIVGLMGLGCLVVLIHPFRFINEKSIIFLYVFFVFLERFI